MGSIYFFYFYLFLFSITWSDGRQHFLYRRDILEKKLADAEVSEEEQNNLLKYLEKKETEYMRIQRHKMGADDFEPLTMIGKGAFGEVQPSFDKCNTVSLFSCYIHIP